MALDLHTSVRSFFKFLLTYPEVDGVVICMADRKYGHSVEIINFRSYEGVKDLQIKWGKQIATWKGWV